MAVESLKCKECGESYPLDARFVCEQCFGPLEVSYDLSDLDPEEARRKIQAGLARASGATPTSCPSTAGPAIRSSRD